MWVISSPATVMLPREGHVETAEKIQQRGFAGAAGAHEGDELAFVHVEIQALQDVDFFAAAAVGFVETADLNQAACRFLCRPLEPFRSLLFPTS